MMSIRKLFIILALLLFSISIGYGQSKGSIMKNIRASFQKINGDTTLKAVKLENEDFTQEATDAGGSLTGYFKHDTICKMQLWIGLSNCVRQFEYYFKNGQVFFIYETEEDFPATGSGELDYKKLNPSFEGRYYFNGGKLIDIKRKGTGRINHQGETMTELMADNKPYENLLKARLKKKK